MGQYYDIETGRYKWFDSTRDVPGKESGSIPILDNANRPIAPPEAAAAAPVAPPQPGMPSFIGTEMVQPGSEAFGRFMGEATRTAGADTPYTKALREGSVYDQMLQGGQMRQRALSDVAASQANLAERGGLSSGASERLASSGQQSLLNAEGQSNAIFNKAIASGKAEDERNRVGMLSAAPGLELGRAEFTQGARERENLAKNAFNSNAYNQQMQAWGAGQTADAQKKVAEESSGK